MVKVTIKKCVWETMGMDAKGITITKDDELQTVNCGRKECSVCNPVKKKTEEPNKEEKKEEKKCQK